MVSKKLKEETKEMKTVDFRKVTLRDVEGKCIEADISKWIGNYLYENTADIAEMDFAKKLYYEGEVELTEEKAGFIREAVCQSASMKAKVKVAVTELLTWG